MADTRIDLAIEAGSKALHENAREKRQFTWGESSEEWRLDLRAFVRPIIEAAVSGHCPAVRRGAARHRRSPRR